jgi:uncharacterized protein
MSRRNFLVALFVMSFMVSVHAQLLWKVSGNGLSKPSYLFGTHHLIEKDQINGFDKILELAGQQDAVVGEMDMGAYAEYADQDDEGYDNEGLYH